MKRYIIHIILLTGLQFGIFNVNAQKILITGSKSNPTLEICTHKDSIPNLLELTYGRLINNGDTLILYELIPFYNAIADDYKRDMKSCLIEPDKEVDSTYSVLDFCFDRMAGITIYTKDTGLISIFRKSIKATVKGKFSAYDSYRSIHLESSHIYGGNKTWSVSFDEYFDSGWGVFRLRDRAIMRRIPSWCGYGIDLRTWKGLRRYMEKRGRKTDKFKNR